jgi:hypothetical protein
MIIQKPARSAPGWMDRTPAPGRVDRLGHFLAELDPELIERVDAEQDGAREDAVLVKGDQRAERRRVEPIEQDRVDGRSPG